MHSLFKDLGFAIILEGARPDVLESISFVGISEDEQNIILRIRDRLLDPDIDGIMHEELIRKGHRKNDTDKKSALLWTVFPMMLSSQRVIGKMIIKGTLEQPSKEVITVFLGQLSAVTQSKLLMRELEKMASTDGLTGVFNRTYFNQEHLQAIINADKYHIPFSIVMVDVNRLKAANDMYGHEKGDEMIIKVASLLKEVCRKTDVVSRIGGDEFAALMPSTNFMQVENAVRRIRKQEEKLEMGCKRTDGKEDIIVPIRISIGVASSDETPPDAVLKEADKRMYLDKERFYEGRERYR
jgi:diguanylate cyclase (GGDEF)-like protein